MRVKQRMNGAFVRLLLVYAALEAFRHSGWMLFYEQVVEAPRQVVNTGFILYSGAIALTALLAQRLDFSGFQQKLSAMEGGRSLLFCYDR